MARLWLPSQIGAIAAGAFFGLSSMLVWRSWYQLNLAAGELFLPLALETAVRLTGRPGQGSRADPEPFSCHLAGDLLDRAVSGQERSERRSVTRRSGSAGGWRGTGELAGSSGRHSMTTS